MAYVPVSPIEKMWPLFAWLRCPSSPYEVGVAPHGQIRFLLPEFRGPSAMDFWLYLSPTLGGALLACFKEKQPHLQTAVSGVLHHIWSDAMEISHASQVS